MYFLKEVNILKIHIILIYILLLLMATVFSSTTKIATQNSIFCGKREAPEGVKEVRITKVFFEGTPEIVEITNIGTATIVLNNWELKSVKAGQDYQLPNLTLKAGEKIDIYSGRGKKGEYVWSGAYIHNNEGDEVILYNHRHKIVDAVCWGDYCKKPLQNSKNESE